MDIFSSIQNLNKVWFDQNNINSFTSEGYERMFFKINKTNNGFKSAIDYNPKANLRMPAFGGIYYIAPEAIHFSADTVLSFKAYSPDGSINFLRVEIKPRGHQWMHESFEFEITNKPTYYKIRFSDFRNKETLECVDEITFVINPDFFTDLNSLKGNITAENINITSKEYSSAPTSETIIDQLKVVEDKVNDISEITGKLYDFVVKNLNGVIINARKELNAKLDKMYNEEQEIAKMITSCSDIINRELHNNIDNKMIEKHKARLGELYGRLWDGLNNETRISLVSAAVLWDGCKGINSDTEFDYSGICISATSALEREVKRIFHLGFKKYIETFCDKSLKFNQKDKREFTLGTLRYLLKFDWDISFELIRSNNVVPYNTHLHNYLKKIKCEKQPNNVVEAIKKAGGFSDEIENIRKIYRNEAAHTNNVSRDLAEECYHTIIGKEEAEKLIVDTHNTLQWLYEIIDIEELLALEKGKSAYAQTHETCKT